MPSHGGIVHCFGCYVADVVTSLDLHDVSFPPCTRAWSHSNAIALAELLSVMTHEAQLSEFESLPKVCFEGNAANPSMHHRGTSMPATRPLYLTDCEPIGSPGRRRYSFQQFSRC
eukprot:4708282-Amphidinium_carterae.1